MAKQWMIGIALVMIFMGAHAPNASAQFGSGESNAPLTITADNSLEWNRDAKTFTANKNAVATRGEVSVRADQLTAYYQAGAGGEEDIQISQLLATGGVVINSPDGKAYGDKAAYDVSTETLVMTGDNLRMIGEGQTVTARDQFEYQAATGKLFADGNATVTQEQNRLRANQLEASFRDTGDGQRALDTIEARGNVVITTPDETLSGPYGIYRARTNTAEISGGVRITRGPNILQGERAEVDLTTNVSRMFGGGNTGRVEGVFFPGSEKSE